MYVNKVRKRLNIYLIRRLISDYRISDFPKCFEPHEAEQKWYEVWEQNKSIQQKDDSCKTYRMILPPPNITGYLHLGHALTTTIQDVLARWYNMKGYEIIWIPGFDHAGIATQAVVEKYLSKQMDVKRTEMKKQVFLGFMDEWKNDKRKVIRNQLKTLGASLNWSKEYFTMDNHHNQAVKKAFLILNERNLLYRDKSLVNWCPTLASTLSDIEVKFETLKGKNSLSVPGYNKKITFGQIFEISYNLKDSDKYLTVATTRPETLLGDVALAIHPDDVRYNQFIGHQVKHPLNETYLPIVADSNVKMHYGTGILKVTPAHNKFDFNIARQCNLDVIEIIDENGNLTDKAGRYQGLPRFTAREKILEDLANLGSLKSIKDHDMEIPLCSRTGDVIELLLREQWFIKCKDMATRASEVVKKGLLNLDPSFHKDTWYKWLDEHNSRDWCVSRQLWWGHKIPAYYCSIDGNIEWVVASSIEEAEQAFTTKYGKKAQVQQDNDVLDTWFSSALLPFSSLGWPTETSEFEKYYPLSLMVTGHDIIFFWVARMVMLGLELTNKLPFSEVLLHAVLCDAKHIKMSKSRGNLIFPETVVNGIDLKNLNLQAYNQYELGILNFEEYKRTINLNDKMFPNGIPKCGVDALRLTLCAHNIRERKVSFNVVECQENKFFLNKIWQASKYVVQMVGGDPIIIPEKYTMIDKWIFGRLSIMLKAVNAVLEKKEFYVALTMIKTFILSEFCSFYLEATKLGFRSKEDHIIVSHKYTLSKCLEVLLRVLAPITPYFSDHLYSLLNNYLSIFECKTTLMNSNYPTDEEFKHFRNIEIEDQITKIINMVTSIRKLLSSISISKDIKGYIVLNNTNDEELYSNNVNLISKLTKLQNLTIVQSENHQVNENSIFYSETNYSINIVSDNKILKKLIENRKSKKKLKNISMES